MCPACLMCTMCTKCTLACRGGGGVSFRESFAAGAQACGMCRRKTQAARCMVACSRWKRGSRGHTAFIIDTLPSVRSPLVRVPTLRHALPALSVCLCAPVGSCHLCSVWVPPSPRVRCRKACITLPYLIHYTVRRAERRLPTATRSTVPAVDSRARGWT